MDDLGNLREKPVLYTVQIGYGDWKKMAEALAKVEKMGYLPTKNENGGDNIFKPSGKNGLWIAKIVKIENPPETWDEYKKRKGLGLMFPKKEEQEKAKWERGRLLRHIEKNEKSW